MEQGDTNNSVKGMAVVIGPIIGVALVLCLLYGYRRAIFRLRNSGSSVGINSTTGLTKTAGLEHRQQQLALINMSPFLASAPIEDIQLDPKQNEPQRSNEALPLDIEVTLVGCNLGSGAFGRVEEGIYIDPDGIRHKVAVKSVHFGEEQSKESLLNEIRIFERVGQHPNIVRCFGGRLHLSVDDESGYYIIEELMETDLGTYFKDQKKRNKITFGKFLHIFYQIALGLEHLHKHEVIHFDLKPGNILLDQSQCPKLADFGCSRQRAHSYITAGARGTIAYMAPELWLLGMYARRAQVRAEKLDIFSYGVVMWESFTKRSPIDPLGVQDLMAVEEATASDAEVTAVGTNEDFRTDRFPLDTSPCPDPLRGLIWDCVSYYNNLRPSVPELKARIQELLEMPWVDQNIDRYKE